MCRCTYQGVVELLASIQTWRYPEGVCAGMWELGLANGADFLGGLVGCLGEWLCKVSAQMDQGG